MVHITRTSGAGHGLAAGVPVTGKKGKSDCRDLGQKADVSPYVYEHVEMVNSIVGDGPYINRAMAVAESTMTAIMAREAAYAGIEVTWDMIMESKLDLMPKRFDLEAEVDIPPLPRPGEYKFT